MPETIKRSGCYHRKMELIDKRQKDKQARITFESIGWKSLLQTRSGTSRILVLKSVVTGLCLERGMPIYSYIGEDEEGRSVMVSYLDGEEKIRRDADER